MTDNTQTTKHLAEQALKYVTFHPPCEANGMSTGFSFDANKYAAEVLEQALLERYCNGVLVGRLQTYNAHKRYCENEIAQIGHRLKRPATDN